MTHNICLQSNKRIKYFLKIAIFIMRKIKYIMGYIYIQIKNKNEQKKLRVTSIAAKRTSKEIFLVYITVVQFHRAFGDLKSSGKL